VVGRNIPGAAPRDADKPERVKRKHRRAERGLIVAETLASLACLLDGAAPESLEPLWRLTLKNEFHDILPGSSIREVYADAERELDEVSAAAAERQARTLAALVALARAAGLTTPC